MESTPALRAVGQIALVGSTACILFFYAEVVFWLGTAPPDPAAYLARHAPAWLLGSFLLPALVKTMRVRRRHALVLAAALCGWIVEAMACPPRYETAAVRASFTGLAWNGLFAGFVGWYALPALLRNGKRLDVAAAAAGIGILWGLWSMGWQATPGAQTVQPLIFLAVAMLATVALVTAYRVYLAAADAGFVVPRGSLPAALAIAAAVSATAARRGRPDLLLVLPILLFAAYAALRRNRRLERHRSMISRAPGPIRGHNDLYLFLMPLTASILYAGTAFLDLGIATHPVIFAAGAVAALVIFASSTALALTRKTGRRSNY